MSVSLNFWALKMIKNPHKCPGFISLDSHGWCLTCVAYLNVHKRECATEKRTLYSFGRTWCWVNGDRMVILVWTILWSKHFPVCQSITESIWNWCTSFGVENKVETIVADDLSHLESKNIDCTTHTVLLTKALVTEH